MAWDHERQPPRQLDSPGVMFFRVVVMLSCLILVPLAAIFGSAFPELVKTHLVDRIKALAGMDDGSQPVSQPPTEAQARPTTAAVEAPRWSTPEGPPPAWQPGVTPATAHQVEYSAPAHSDSPVVRPQNPDGAVDHFTEIQQQLRSYGASHYALEAVGAAGDLYRFHCKMQVPGIDNVQEFEATDRDPLQAMARVLSQVEAWRQNSAGPTPHRLR